MTNHKEVREYDVKKLERIKHFLCYFIVDDKLLKNIIHTLTEAHALSLYEEFSNFVNPPKDGINPFINTFGEFQGMPYALIFKQSTFRKGCECQLSIYYMEKEN